jgi:hypothetical protein
MYSCHRQKVLYVLQIGMGEYMYNFAVSGLFYLGGKRRRTVMPISEIHIYSVIKVVD